MILFILFLGWCGVVWGNPRQTLGDNALVLFKTSTGCYYSSLRICQVVYETVCAASHPLFDVMLGHAAVAACLYNRNRDVVGWQ